MNCSRSGKTQLYLGSDSLKVRLTGSHLLRLLLAGYQTLVS